MGLLPDIVAGGSGEIAHTNQVYDKLNAAHIDVVADFGAVGDGVTDDTAAIQAAIAAAEAAGGGEVFFPALDFLTDALTVSAGGVYLNGASSHSTVLKARTAGITDLITWQVVSGRLSRGGISNLTIHGNNGKATNGVKVDSSRFWSCSNVRGLDLPGYLVDMISNQAAYTEGWSLDKCDTDNDAASDTGGLFRGRAGTAGLVADGSIRNCMALSLSSSRWAVVLSDCQRVKVDNLWAANNTATFGGAVLVTNPGDGLASSASTGYHSIEDVYLEDQSGGGTAVCVRIEAPTGATQFNQHTVVQGTAVTPETRKHLELANVSATTNRVRLNRFMNPRGIMNTAGNVTIGANCIYTHVIVQGEGGAKIASAIVDNGSHNRVNLMRFAAHGSGVSPATTFIDVGDIVRNTSDGAMWIMDRTGTMRQLAGPWVGDQKFLADVELDGALNHDGSTVGFYGTAPITKQTGVAVDATAIHAALVALGLISA